MKRIILFVFMLIAQQTYCIAQDVTVLEDSTAVDSLYIPSGIKECIYEIDNLFDDDVRNEILSLDEDEYVEIATNGLSVWLRSNWDTFRGYCLSKYFPYEDWKGTEYIAETLSRYYYRYLKLEQFDQTTVEIK